MSQESWDKSPGVPSSHRSDPAPSTWGAGPRAGGSREQDSARGLAQVAPVLLGASRSLHAVQGGGAPLWAPGKGQ